MTLSIYNFEWWNHVKNINKKLAKEKNSNKKNRDKIWYKKNKGGWNLKKKNDKQIKLQLKEWGLKLKIKKSYGVKLINICNLIDYL